MFGFLHSKKLDYICNKWRKSDASEFSEHYQIRLISVACLISINKASNAILYLCGYLNNMGY